MNPQVIKVMIGGWGFGTGGAVLGLLVTAAIFDNPGEHPVAALAIPALCSIAGQYLGIAFFLGK